VYNFVSVLRVALMRFDISSLPRKSAAEIQQEGTLTTMSEMHLATRLERRARGMLHLSAALTGFWGLRATA
jgi:hypothetical protein